MPVSANNPICLHPSARPAAILAALTLTALILTGCTGGLAPSSIVAPAASSAAVFSGRVMGGQQPVANASIALWQVNTDGSAASSMLTTPVTTDSNGDFSIPAGDYPNASTHCTATTQVYLTADGGNPGSGNPTNPALALMAALGPCSALSSSTQIQINEVTTVASVWALQQFIGVSEGTPFAEDVAVGPNAQSATGMANAFAIVPTLVSISGGSANTTVGNASSEASKINAIANVLASCVNSDGATDCQNLFSAVTPPGSIAPGDTIQAALYMAQNPSNNVTTIFDLQSSSPPFEPDLTTAPFDWSLAITYTNDGLNLPNLLASDSNGNIWISDAATTGNEALVELTPAGTPATGSPFLSGANVAFDGPEAVVPDTLGNIWISAHNTSNSTGNRLVAFNPATSSATSYPLTSGCDPYALAIDGKDNLFFACSALGYLYEFPNLTSGTPSSANLPSYSTSATQLGPIGSESYGAAIDSLSDIWIANTTASPTDSVTGYAPSNYTAVANTFSLGSSPVGIAVDHSNNVWAASSDKLNEFIDSSGSYTATDFTGGGLASARYVAVDGAGNLWVSNGTAPTISATTYVTLSEFSNAGLALTPGLSSLQPGGLATPTTATAPTPRGLTIDPSGNVWIAGCGSSTSCTGNSSFVTEYIGVASPPIVPLSTALAANQLGCCSFTPAPPTGSTPTDTAGDIGLQASSWAVTQNSGQFAFEITRTAGFKGALKITYTTLDGSAKAGTDYTASSGTLTWADGDSSIRTITVPWLDTANYSGARTFSISLSCSSSCPAAFSPAQTELVSVTDNLTPPSTLFAFNNSKLAYYLGLPIDIYGGDGGIGGAQFEAQSITSAVLASGFSDPYFYLNGSNQMVFTAPSTGATTSPGSGSDDTRSELREEYYGPGNSYSRDWDSTIGGTLTATCFVNAVSADTSEATIGQIHGQNQPFVLLEYLPASNSVAVSILNTNSSDSGSTSTTMATGLSLNSEIDYKLQLSGSTLTVTVNGNTQTFTVDSSWTGSGNGLYFKLGAYSGASNTGNPPGDRTQVTFSTFSVTHP